MSTVDKMLIKGIRSFSPDNTHVITFYKPLTLIVGPNGAGKTTIIESLKHACTGELPPNARSGQSFVHDPKVAGETEVKGQIKLRFKTAAAKDVVCIRSFQLTQKGTKLEYKAIESVLQTIDPLSGEKVCLSYRCADMDREVPALMGVSKAILENVIFVHQDEANWPLADGATLKKKFDDIFSATKYTKALEVIKKLHKEQAQEIKMQKLKLENAQTLRDAAYKLQESIDHDSESSDKLKSQSQKLDREIAEVQLRINHLDKTIRDLRRLHEEVRVLDTKRSTLFKHQEQQYAKLTEENEDMDEELMDWQAKFEQNLVVLRMKISKGERDAADYTTQIDILNKKYNQECVSIGKQQAEADAFRETERDRDAKIQLLFRDYNLGSVGASLSHEAALQMTNRAEVRLKELMKDVDDKKHAGEAEVSKVWKLIEANSKKLSELQGQLDAKRKAQEEAEKRVEEIDTELEDLAHVKFDVSGLDEKEKQMEEEVNRQSSKLSEKNFETEIDNLRVEIYRLEQRIKTLHREKDGIAKESVDRVQLDLKRDDLADKERKLKRIMDDNKESVRKALKGRFPGAESLKKEIGDVLRSTSEEFKCMNDKSLVAKQEVDLVSLKLQDARAELSSAQRDRDAKRKVILSRLSAMREVQVDIEAFSSNLQEAIEKKEIRKSQHDMADGMRRMFEPFEKVARANHVCPCCERPFTPQEEDDFVKKQRIKSSSTADRLRELASHYSQAESKVQQLEKLRPVYEDYTKLVLNTVPATEKLIAELQEDYESKSRALHDLEDLSVHAKTEKDLIEKLYQAADAVDKLGQEAKMIRSQIGDLEYKLNISSQGLRSVEEIQSELLKSGDLRDTLNKSLERLVAEQIHLKDDFNTASNRLRDVREEKLKVLAELNKVKGLRMERNRLLEQISQAQLDVQLKSEEAAPLGRENDGLKQDHAKLSERVKLENFESSRNLAAFESAIQSIHTIIFKIKEYIESRKDKKLQESQDRLLQIDAQRQQSENRRSEVEAEVNKSRELLQSQAAVKRNIDDNIEYRKSKAEVEELARQIEKCEEKILQTGDLAALELEVKKVIEEKQALVSELDRSKGTLTVYQSNIVKNKTELKQVQYKDIEKRYCAQLIQLKTTEMANKDLDKYYNALDRALMRFHSMKMEEINKIIKELWQQTYQGQDIDYIAIRSDAEGAGSRSYSYRVVMQSGDAELEMRGRCSAGQKVLASLIIRLALAETFCLSCGILALDEPTTNLDGRNAESLAAALLRIMEDRKGQENFQLIVITHDERFAQLIGQRQHAEKYYRISKDDHQHSIIEAQEIFE
ncbi:hypothetical protein GOP47_0001521 [Adiantum capillus-veneris]|uniref:DNA repair protein RAD50 n=1 Tax=Adiantum capillus-veneris TaxID=13818 RepID=A0A9D4V8V1_ADICA|nr:hypothetical protein GOP47_0001521 [Adiantum capillus-veneris]